MSVEVFVDTNLLYYANTESPDPRHARARDLVESLWSEPGKAAISVQVLQELHVNLIRKGGLDPSASWRRVSDYLAWKVVDNDRLLLSSAVEVQTRWKLSFFATEYDEARAWRGFGRERAAISPAKPPARPFRRSASKKAGSFTVRDKSRSRHLRIVTTEPRMSLFTLTSHAYYLAERRNVYLSGT